MAALATVQHNYERQSRQAVDKVRDVRERIATKNSLERLHRAVVTAVQESRAFGEKKS